MIINIAGATANDLNDRIERIANKVRELFFGPPNEFFFICRKENGSERIISLPDKEGNFSHSSVILVLKNNFVQTSNKKLKVNCRIKKVLRPSTFANG